MNQSESIKNLAAALVKVQSQMSTVPLDGYNPHFKSRFTTMTTMWETARPLLAENGLAVIQLPSNWPDQPWLLIQTTLLHTSGEWVSDSFVMPLAKNDPQGVGAAITYGRRFSFAALLGIVSDVEDDGEPGPRGGSEGQNRNRGSQSPPNASRQPNPRPTPQTSASGQARPPSEPVSDTAEAAPDPEQAKRGKFIGRIEVLRKSILELKGDPGNDDLNTMTLDELTEVGKELGEQLKRLQKTREEEAAKAESKGKAAPPARRAK